MLNGKASNWGRINAGVPQGSVLGRLLFLIYINDLTSVVNNCKIRLFADDTCLFTEVNDREQAAALIEQDLHNIFEWSKQWLVNFSASKTKSLIISNKKDRHLNPAVHFNGTQIIEVNSHTYLGLNFSFNLKWSEHIESISQKSNAAFKV